MKITNSIVLFFIFLVSSISTIILIIPFCSSYPGTPVYVSLPAKMYDDYRYVHKIIWQKIKLFMESMILCQSKVLEEHSGKPPRPGMITQQNKI